MSERALVGSRWELSTADGTARVKVIEHGSRPYRARGHRVFLKTESGPEIIGHLWEVDLLTSPNAKTLAGETP
jgi:hypothetical protein